jgi:hypothetical protein
MRVRNAVVLLLKLWANMILLIIDMSLSRFVPNVVKSINFSERCTHDNRAGIEKQNKRNQNPPRRLQRSTRNTAMTLYDKLLDAAYDILCYLDTLSLLLKHHHK